MSIVSNFFVVCVFVFFDHDIGFPFVFCSLFDLYAIFFLFVYLNCQLVRVSVSFNVCIIFFDFVTRSFILNFVLCRCLFALQKEPLSCSDLVTRWTGTGFCLFVPLLKSHLIKSSRNLSSNTFIRIQYLKLCFMFCF